MITIMSKVFKAITIINLLLISAFASYYLGEAKVEVAFVYSSKLINGYKGMEVARKDFESKAIVWKANIDSLALEVNREIMEFEKGNSRMSSKERSLSQELIKAKQSQLAQYQQAMQAKAREEDAKVTKAVLEKINAYIATYGKEKGITIILAATDYGNIAYADSKLDLTEEVLQGLNNEFAGK